jgi:hypothetical protein
MAQIVECEDTRHVCVTPKDLHTILPDLDPIGSNYVLGDVFLEHDPLIGSFNDAHGAGAIPTEVAMAEMARVFVIPGDVNSVGLCPDLGNSWSSSLRGHLAD